MNPRIIAHKRRRLNLLEIQCKDKIKWRGTRIAMPNNDVVYEAGFRECWNVEYMYGEKIIRQLDVAILELEKEFKDYKAYWRRGQLPISHVSTSVEFRIVLSLELRTTEDNLTGSDDRFTRTELTIIT
jgi:hypothetical protein